MVETQLCKLRSTSDTFVGRADPIFFIYNVYFMNETYDIINTQFH